MELSLSPRALRAVVVLGLTTIAGYLWLVLHVASTGTYGAWAALVVIPVLLMVNVLLLLRAGRRDPDPRFGTLLLVAFVLKCLATGARYYMAQVVYDGVADAGVYNAEGARLAAEYRDGDFGADIGRDFIGTGFMRVATAVVYVVTGPSVYVAWLVFSLVGFWGTYFLYRAFRTAVPGDSRRYALLLLLLPSMLFWPTGIGKEAFVTLGIGLTAYGSALLLSGYRTWLVPLLLGVLATGVVRPHITAALFTALAMATFLRRRTHAATELTPVAYVGGAVAIMAAGGVVALWAASFLGVDLSVQGLTTALSDTTELTDEGGSTFTPATVYSPVDLPWAMFTILFRPLVIEATNPQMMLAAVEGSLLLLLIAVSWRSWVGLLGRLRRQPYLIFALVYVVVFCYAFSNFGNFGILTRQRVQVLPFLLVFLALRPPRVRVEPTTSDREKVR